MGAFFIYTHDDDSNNQEGAKVVEVNLDIDD